MVSFFLFPIDGFNKLKNMDLRSGARKDNTRKLKLWQAPSLSFNAIACLQHKSNFGYLMLK